jgi:hypothetical protein
MFWGCRWHCTRVWENTLYDAIFTQLESTHLVNLRIEVVHQFLLEGELMLALHVVELLEEA